MRAILFDTVTGRYVHDLEYTSCSWDTGVLAPDSVKITVPLYTRRAQSTRLSQLLTPRQRGVAIVHDAGHVIAAGYINGVSLSQDADSFEKYDVQVRGIEGLFDTYHVRKHPGWPLVNTAGQPVTTYDMTITGVEYGTMMKRLLTNALKFGSLPISFEPDRTGTREKSWLALDGKPVLEALDDITELENGIEYDFVPVFDGDRVSFEFVTGTDKDRVIVPQRSAVFPMGGSTGRVAGFEREIDSTNTSSAAFFTGGKSEDSVLVAAATSTRLTDSGFPYSEAWDSSHSTVSVQSTLQEYANGAVQSAGLVETWKCQVRGAKYPTLRHGDVVTVEALDSTYLPNGVWERRVLSLSGSAESEWVSVTLV